MRSLLLMLGVSVFAMLLPFSMTVVPDIACQHAVAEAGPTIPMLVPPLGIPVVASLPDDPSLLQRVTSGTADLPDARFRRSSLADSAPAPVTPDLRPRRGKHLRPLGLV